LPLDLVEEPPQRLIPSLSQHDLSYSEIPGHQHGVPFAPSQIS
jgi:hypothetical protein